MSAGRFTARSPFLRGRPSGLEADLINRLRKLPVGHTPDARFKSDLRSQLVAITARIVAESSTAAETVARRPAKVAAAARAATPATARTRHHGLRNVARHPIASLTALFAALVVGLTTVTAMAAGALPGDSLYDVKRAHESLQLSLASGDLAKGHAYLKQASERLDEARDLLARNTSARNQNLAASALVDADSSSRSGMQALGRAAVSDLVAKPLDDVDVWIVGQRGPLQAIRNNPSAGAAATQAAASLALLDRISTRSSALRSKLSCPCLSTANSDDLGPVPCEPCKPLIVNSRPSIPAAPPLQLPTSLPTGALPTSVPSLSIPGTSGALRTQVPSAVPTPNPNISSGGLNLQLPSGLPLTSGLPALPDVGITAVPGVSLGAQGDGLSLSGPSAKATDLMSALGLN